MRISDLVPETRLKPEYGWRKFLYNASFKTINPGESPRERHYRQLKGTIGRHIRRQYVVTFVSGKGGTGASTLTAAVGSAFRVSRSQNSPVVAVDAVPGFGTLSDRIDERPQGDYASILNDTDVQGYSDIREYLGQNVDGLDVLAGNRTSDQPRPLVPAAFKGVMSRLRRTHDVILVDTGADLEHPVMKAVLDDTNTLVFVSGITADRSKPVMRALDYLVSQGYHELVSRSMVIINHSTEAVDPDAVKFLQDKFAKTGATVEVMPFDAHLARGGIIDVHDERRTELQKKTHKRLFEIAAKLAEKYVPEIPGFAQ
jgi:MinD-like ATPase involved in chromosome partitioning or flagellar assembly